MVMRAFLALALLMLPAAAAGQQTASPDAIDVLVARLEAAGVAGDPAAIVRLGAAADAPGLQDFAGGATNRPTRFIVKERDRSTFESGSSRLLLEAFAEYGNQSVITTWRVDVIPPRLTGSPAIIQAMEQLTVVSGLYRLSLNPAKQFDVRNLTVEGTDLRLELPSGQAFVAETSDGPTAVVLIGRGRMRFSPPDPAEKTQLRIFGGDDVLSTEFDAAFIRVRPSEFERTFRQGTLAPRAVDAGDLRRASQIFEDHIGQTLQLDLTDLSRDRWSLVPNIGDLIVELRTRRMGNLTYARSSKDAEDVSLFDRRRRRNIAVYASEQKLASRGRFYSEDDQAEYDVLRYDIDASFSPERLWIDGTAQMKVKIRSYALTALTLRLAESLAVRSITSPEYGRLLYLRVVGQNSVIVNLPTAATRDTELWINVVYGGRLEAQAIDRESLAVASQQEQIQEQVYIPIEPQYVYSNRSYWYPQSPVTDYASARLRIAVPQELDVVATGTAVGPPAPAPGPVPPGQRAKKLFVFEADEPVRYLACVISRFQRVNARRVTIPATPATAPRSSTRALARTPPVGAVADADDDREGSPVMLEVFANPRQTGRARSLAERAEEMLAFYAGLIGDAPYPTFTLAVTENELPGGHSPAYFALLNQPMPLVQLVWRNDPVAFDGYPSYFLAHEIAHQWWGQAIGWKNYHEQWLSEGFAQYFAVLYAANDRGDDQLTSMLRQMRRWAMDQSSQGPVYLGYRLGHIRGDARVFRAIIYNKGAMVLHMLRRLLGDDQFFAGIRAFYREWKFKKAGSDDFRAALEKASGRDLSIFFDAWIHGVAVPDLRFSSTVTGNEAAIRFEHRGEVVPVPITVSISYSDGRVDEIVVPVTERIVERTIELRGTVRSIDTNRDHAAVADISR